MGCSRAEKGGLLTWGSYSREDSVEGCQLPTFPTARGINASVLKWGINLDGVRRFHYGVGRPEVKSTCHFYPYQCLTPQCVSYVLMRPKVGVVAMDETTEPVHLKKDSLWLSR